MVVGDRRGRESAVGRGQASRPPAPVSRKDSFCGARPLPIYKNDSFCGVGGVVGGDGNFVLLFLAARGENLSGFVLFDCAHQRPPANHVPPSPPLDRVSNKN